METELAEDDIPLMLREIQRFCRKSIQPLVERPEKIIEAEQLAQLTGQAREIGLINPSVEPGTGLWENPECDAWVRLSSTALRCIGHTNAGIAFHFHQLALGRYASCCLGIDGDQQSVVCVQGAYGLARCSLARLLKRTRLGEEDWNLLQDYFVTLGRREENLPQLFQAGDRWGLLLVPCLNECREFGWAAFAREDLKAAPVPHSHGLDEIFTWQWQPRDESPRHWIAGPDKGLALYGKVLNLTAQALVAIALGALTSGYEKAAEYAVLRKQGGKPINQHAAVRQMLARCASTVRTVELLREQLSRLAVTSSNLGTVFAVRAQVHNLLATAANDALQTLGGSGYTREAGLEKIVRDGNHLRLLCGTPDELLMFVSQWEDNG